MKQIKANMNGNIWKVLVEVGDQVDHGMEVIILESMKMEIPITAESKGTVKEIRIQEGDAVNEDDVLIVLE